MPTVETNTRRIIARLRKDGWFDDGGAKHDVFRHREKSGIVVVPRHRKLNTARMIAKAAGWQEEQE